MEAILLHILYQLHAACQSLWMKKKTYAHGNGAKSGEQGKKII
jgi:hypothetical protein